MVPKKIGDDFCLTKSIFWCVTTLLSMTFAAFLARAAHLFTSKTSGQLPARNIANGSALSDLVRSVSRLFRTLRYFLVSLNLMSGSVHNTAPLLFDNFKNVNYETNKKIFCIKVSICETVCKLPLLPF